MIEYRTFFGHWNDEWTPAKREGEAVEWLYTLLQ